MRAVTCVCVLGVMHGVMHGVMVLGGRCDRRLCIRQYGFKIFPKLRYRAPAPGPNHGAPCHLLKTVTPPSENPVLEKKSKIAICRRMPSYHDFFSDFHVTGKIALCQHMCRHIAVEVLA